MGQEGTEYEQLIHSITILEEQNGGMGMKSLQTLEQTGLYIFIF